MATILEKIHEFNRFGSVLGLERMEILLGKLGNPHEDLDVIHVAGTNGKGSVCKFLEEGLGACGYKVGLYTSPFIESFNERIRLGGRDITDEELENYGGRVLAAAEEMVAEGHQSPTEFEVVTAIAFLYFRENGTDIAVLEVGLGGKGDSTNVVKEPLAAVICSISYDHMDRLGNTLSEIAADKAGIIKKAVPIIANVPEREAAAVIAKKAYETGSRLYDISKLKFSIADATLFSQMVSMEIYGTDYSNIEISMVGNHQGENLKTALVVIEILRKAKKIKVERSRLYQGLKKARQPGRFEVMDIVNTDAETKLLVILDGAHNEAGARALRETTEKYFSGKKILLIMGMLADKQVDEVLGNLIQITSDIIVTEPDNPRKLKTDKLEQHLKDMGMKSQTAADAKESVELAMRIGENYDVVIFAGSLYLIGDVRRILRDEYQ